MKFYIHYPDIYGTVHTEFLRYVNYMDYEVSRAAVKTYSLKILPPRII